MPRIVFVGEVALTLCLLLTACEVDQPDSPLLPYPAEPVTAQIAGLDSAIYAREGDLRVAAFQVYLRHKPTGRDAYAPKEGSPAALCPVSVWVAEGPGYAVLSAPLADSAGIITAIYFLQVPYGTENARLAATAGADTVYKSIRLFGSSIPSQISIAATPDRLELRPKLPATGSIIITITDARGTPCAGQIARVDVLRGAVDLPSFIRTQGDGTAELRFKLNGEISNELEIAATVVDHEDEIMRPTEAILRELPLLTDFKRGPVSARVRIPVARALPATLRFAPPDMLPEPNPETNALPFRLVLRDVSGAPICDAAIRIEVLAGCAAKPWTLFTDDNGEVQGIVVSNSGAVELLATSTKFGLSARTFVKGEK